ncbi:hypothetical protein OH76DRAFT_1365960, partial [Lentinus brumalis]
MAAAPDTLRRSPRRAAAGGRAPSQPPPGRTPQTVVPITPRDPQVKKLQARERARAAAIQTREQQKLDATLADLHTPAQPAPRKVKEPTPPAESGRPETSREFAKRIKRVVLRVNDEGREGANPMGTVEPTEDLPSEASAAAADTSVAHEPVVPDKDLPPPPAVLLGDRFLELLAESTEGVDLLKALRGRYGEDRFFAKILEKPKEYKNFRQSDGLIFIRERGQERLCLPEVLIEGRSVREIVITHAHSILAHLGAYKTQGLLRDHVWWKT